MANLNSKLTQILLAATLALPGAGYAGDKKQEKAAAAAAAQAAAEADAKVVRSRSIVPGYYTDAKGGHQLYIKEVVENGFATYYAAIIWKANFVSLYRIEDVDGSTQAWLNLYQSKDNQIATDEKMTATYAVTPLKADGKLSLRFTWTDFASKIGTNVPCSIIPSFEYRGTDKAWGDFSSVASGRYQGSRSRLRSEQKIDGKKMSPKTELIMSAIHSQEFNVLATNMILESMNEKIWTNKDINRDQAPEQTIYNGEYKGTELLPGIMIMKRKQLDSMTAAGISLDNEISMFAIPLTTGGKAKSLEKVMVVHMRPGDLECAYLRNEVKRK